MPPQRLGRAARPRPAPALLLAMALGAIGCRRDPAPPGPAPGPAPPATTGAPRRTYPLTGTVRDVNPQTGVVSIRHDEIAGLMPAMTMPFTLDDHEILEDLRPGDQVRATLRVAGDDYALEDVEITQPAEPPALRLDLSGDGPALRVERPILEPGEPVPDFTMTTQQGETLSLSDLRGQVVVLTFIYTRCPLPNFCPLMDKRFSALAGMIQPIPDRARAVRLLSVSFDPEHDTPEVLAAHARLRGARPPLWTFAVAGHDELRKVAEPLGLKYGPTANEIIHGLSTAVIAPDGTLARLENGNDWTPEDLHRTVVGLLPRVAATGGATPSR